MLRSVPNLSPLAGNRLPRLLAVLLALVCAAVAMMWALRLLAAPRQVPGDAVLVGSLGPEQAAAQAARLFAAQPVVDHATAETPGRYRLYGVIAGGAAGSALIGVDGKPPRAVAVGQPAAPGAVLRETGYKQVWLDVDGRRVELKLDPERAGRLATPSVNHAPQPASMAPVIAPQVRVPTPPPVGERPVDNEQ